MAQIQLFLNNLRNWMIEIICFIFFTIILASLQFYFLKYGFQDPGLIGYIYLKNFVNLSWDRFFVNILVMWLGLFLIFLLTARKEKFQIWSNLLFILIISPVILTLFDLFMITAPMGIRSIGYSGISSMFLGFGFFTLATFFFYAWKNDLLKRKISKFQIIFIIGLTLILPVLSFTFYADPIEIGLILTYGIIEGVYQTFLQAKINIFIHVFGYLLGVCTPVITREIIPICE